MAAAGLGALQYSLPETAMPQPSSVAQGSVQLSPRIAYQSSSPVARRTRAYTHGSLTCTNESMPPAMPLRQFLAQMPASTPPTPKARSLTGAALSPGAQLAPAMAGVSVSFSSPTMSPARNAGLPPRTYAPVIPVRAPVISDPMSPLSPYRQSPWNSERPFQTLFFETNQSYPAAYMSPVPSPRALQQACSPRQLFLPCAAPSSFSTANAALETEAIEHQQRQVD